MTGTIFTFSCSIFMNLTSMGLSLAGEKKRRLETKNEIRKNCKAANLRTTSVQEHEFHRCKARPKINVDLTRFVET